MEEAIRRAWWKEAVVYQIYPRSFQDTNGDGVGDLPGVIRRLDYVKELGADVIWLNPIYRSPNDDNGYDISDYRAIMEEFGTMADFDVLLREAHARGIRIVMDLVVNHTSDEHPWFVESRKSKDNPYRDYYIWREGKNGAEPNNWGGSFSGSAWQLDEATGMYYLHLFSKKQPDLNWENPKVRREVYDLMRFWLDKGIDGFRMDVINFISKTADFPDGETNGGLYGDFGPFCINGPRIHEFLHEMNREALAPYDVMTVGEMPGATPEQAALYTGFDREELNMIFQFEHVGLDGGEYGKWSLNRVPLRALKETLSKWQTELDGRGWNSLYWNNHDQPRVVSRFGDDSTPLFREKSAKMLATLLHMLQGTPYIYQGEELGMTNVAFPSIDDYRDIETLNAYREFTGRRGVAPDEMLAYIHKNSRDNARTPMQWDDSPNAGFTTGTPWIAVNPAYREINAKAALADPNSVFYYYKKLIALRREYPIIVYGHYRLLLPDDDRVYACERSLNGEKLLVVCSFSREAIPFPLPVPEGAELLLGNYEGESGDLRPFEARVYRYRE